MHSQELKKILLRYKEDGEQVQMRQISTRKLTEDGGGGFAIDVYDRELYDCKTALYVSELEFLEDYKELDVSLHTRNMPADNVREGHALKRRYMLIAPHYILTVQWDHSKKWAVGACCDTRKDGWDKSKAELEEKYPDATFAVERITEENIDLSRNYL